MPTASRRLAESITRAASLQTYCTIKLLADRGRSDDACRAYAYFRWVDDWLDEAQRLKPERLAFLERQSSLIADCYDGKHPAHLTPEEQILVDLVSADPDRGSALAQYVDNMLAMMAFDTERRGRLISQAELNAYQRYLAVAVTEILDYFIGHDQASRLGESRYAAVTAAHVTHMLRDTWEDAQLGYFNIPVEYLEAHKLSPLDVDNPAYLAWVRSRVQTARRYFQEACEYMADVKGARFRLAVCAYTARFEIVLDMMERDGFRLRRDYSARRSTVSGLRMAWAILHSATQARTAGARLPCPGVKVD